MFKTGIGISDFEEIISSNNFYADKTMLIADLIENNDKVILITRPRRFGKTLNLNMLKYFFAVEHKDKENLFYNLDIWKTDKYKSFQGRFPTIFLTFKDNNKMNFNDSAEKMIYDLAEIYQDFSYLLAENILDDDEKAEFKRIKSKTASKIEYQNSLSKLCKYLYRKYNEKVFLLIDEYDTPMQEAHLNGYWNEMSDMIRGILGPTLKDQSFLYKAVITGITRIAKENLFSGVNNLKVCTIFDSLYSRYFGFKESEVLYALESLNMLEKSKEIKQWYNGYSFGNFDNPNEAIYNPWSVLEYLSNKKPATYWANTSDNGLIKKYSKLMDEDGKIQLETLIAGGEIEATVDNNMIYSDLDDKGLLDRIWSLFLISGYLKINSKIISESGVNKYLLSIPNKEIMLIYQQTIKEWFEISSISREYREFICSLENCDIKMMEIFLNKISRETFSYFDMGKNQAESFYHAFFLGMIISLKDKYLIDSIKESGYGRYDVCLKPLDKSKYGYIIEFKAFDEDIHKVLKKF